MGRNGQGALVVSDGGAVSTQFFEVATDGVGVATFTGAGSSLTISSDGGRLSGPLEHVAGVSLIARNTGSSGILNILDGASMVIRSGIGANEDTTVPSFQMGLETESLGIVNVTGAGSQIEVLQENPDAGFGGPLFEIGRAGIGNVEINGGGSFSVLGPNLFGTLGGAPGGVGSVRVQGAGSSLVMDAQGDRGQFFVGQAGSGILNVSAGAMATLAVDIVTVGEAAGSTGSILVDGAGSTLNVLDTFEIGRGGVGSLAVVNGGEVVNGPAGFTFVGREPTGDGTVTLDGTGSLLDAGNKLLIGSNYDFIENVPLPNLGGLGSVTVGAGATVEAGAAQNDGINDIIIGVGGFLQVQTGGTVIGDVVNLGGVFDTGASPGTATIQGDFHSHRRFLHHRGGGHSHGRIRFHRRDRFCVPQQRADRIRFHLRISAGTRRQLHLPLCQHRLAGQSLEPLLCGQRAGHGL